MATAEEITNAGAATGYASPVGLKNALIVVMISFHNRQIWRRVQTRQTITCSTQTADETILPHRRRLNPSQGGDTCINCGNQLSTFAALRLATRSEFNFENILLALAETPTMARDSPSPSLLRRLTYI